MHSEGRRGTRDILGYPFCIECSARLLTYVAPFNAHKDPRRFCPHFADEDIVAQGLRD